MPYKIKKAPGRNLYWVITEQDGRHLSKDPLPLEQAKKQLAAVNIAYAREAGYKIPKKK